MGYSIGLFARNEGLQVAMWDFMEREYRPHWRIRGRPEGPCYSSPPRLNVDYVHGKHVLGIDYGACGGFERGYGFALVRWMALKVGRSRRSFKEPKVKFQEPVPYMSYDSEALWPILVKPLSSVPKALRWCCVDRYGVKLDPTTYDDFIFDIPDHEAFKKAQIDACKKHGIDPDNWPAPENEPKGVRWKIHDTRARLLWPEIQKVIEPIRVELKRLDTQWCKEAHVGKLPAMRVG